MDFYLYYRGLLKGNGRPEHKQKIRRCFHQQLKVLWDQEPLKDYQQWLDGSDDHKEGPWFHRPMGDFTFVPLVTERANLVAELDIMLLTQEAPGCIITQ